ncbi:MAG TPA: histidinol phosphatase [Ferruginibacter sp.]|nr:histidinol phosphatase [Ferruginibacter sp.]
MFNFFKTKKTEENIHNSLPVSTDIHSHILPGIDDGSPDVESSLVLIKGMMDLGIRKFIATPHIIGDLYRNTPQTINTALEETKAACKKAGMNVELSAAAEYMIDDYFLELLKKKSPLLTLHKNILLTEISYSTPPVNLEAITATIIAEGYKPILAHPERYHFYHYNPDIYYHLKEMGFHLQVNLLSLTGYYGKGVKKAARFLIQKNLASLVGTDLHHKYHLAAFNDPKNQAVIHEILGSRKFNDLEALAGQ